jgi:ACS family glucarate transporter-like MFS transporter
MAGPNAGAISAAMNTAGQVGGVLSPIAFAMLTEGGGGSWSAPLYVTAGLYAFGAVCWAFVRPERAISQD